MLLNTAVLQSDTSLFHKEKIQNQSFAEVLRIPVLICTKPNPKQ